jgi:hypothetical protein
MNTDIFNTIRFMLEPVILNGGLQSVVKNLTNPMLPVWLSKTVEALS